jgi:diguanylate cyclase (GGDEF)-like protein/putative nucleotidyltransferase with HDIG domain
MTIPEPLLATSASDHNDHQMLSLRDLFASVASISAVSSLHELLPHLAGLLARSVSAQRCTIFLFDRDMTCVVDHLRWGYGDDELASLERTSVVVNPGTNQAIQHVAETGQVLLRSPDETPLHLQPTRVHERGVHWPGDMVVPLIWNGRIEGCAYILLPDGADRFAPLQVEIAGTVALQAAGIINHLRTAEAERDARQQTELLLELSRSFSRATTLADVYDTFAQAVHTAANVDAVSVVVHAHSVLASGKVVNRRVTAIGMTDNEMSVRDEVLSERLALSSSIDRFASELDRPVLIDDLSSWVDDKRILNNLVENHVSGLLAVPLMVSNQLHGMLYGWCHKRTTDVSDERLDFIGTIANHASASIERLLLVETERNRRQRTETLAQVQRAIALAGDPVDLLQIATGAIRDVLNADFATAVTVNLESQSPGSFTADGLTPSEMASLLPRLAHNPSFRFSMSDNPVAARVIDTGELLTIWPFPEATGHTRENEIFAMPEHAIEVPIVVHQEHAGMIHAWFRNGNTTVRETDVEIAADIVRDVTLAIERVTALESERHQWNRAETLRLFSETLNRSIELPAVSTAIDRALQVSLSGAQTALATCNDAASGVTLSSSFDQIDLALVERAVHETLEQREPALCTNGQHSILAVPLFAGDEPLGALVVARAGTNTTTAIDVETVTSLAPQAADAIQRARLYAVSERTIAELRLLHEVSRAIARRTNQSDILDYLSVEVRKLINYSTGLIALDEGEPGCLTIASAWGEFRFDGLGKHVPVSTTITGSVYASYEPALVDNASGQYMAWDEDIVVWKSIVCVPIMTGSRAIGAMFLGHHEAGMFTREDVRLASLLAGQAGAAIYQARESERQRELYRAGVEALAAAVDAKDSYIHSHSRQVAELSRRTAEVLNLGPGEIERIELAGLLHDVGKIGIPDHILTKPGRLDPQERLIMISHATLGARIISSHPALAEMSNIVLHHHEWHNGSGYPDGLRGDEIPIGSAIIAVADAYDSMTTYRPYRKILAHEAACQELVDWTGTQFHPRVVEAFLSWIQASDVPGAALSGAVLPLQPIQAVDIVGPRVMAQIALEISQLTDLYPFLNRLQQIIRDVLGYEEINIFVADEADEQLTLGASTTNAEISGRLRIPYGEGVAGMVARSGQALLCPDVHEDGRAGYIDLSMRSIMAVPLRSGSQLVGILGAGSSEPHRFEDRDLLQLEAIAHEIAPTLMVSRLHDTTRLAATTDGLTGVMNHRAFYERLELMIAELDHWDDDLHLLIIDVIGLKAINDVHGHLAGDRALIAVASALKARVRAEDEIARYGGDEFVVIVRGTPRAGLDELVERINAPVEFSLDQGYQLSLRLRCGIATAHSSAERATELVARADAGLYADVSPTMRAGA